MLTTLATSMVASLIAVSFGWVPAESSDNDADQAGYEYLVQLSPADLAALSAGESRDLVSELPTNVGPIERVRVYVGVDDVPQRLSERDASSPKRIAAQAGPQRRTVAKPVIPEWPDAAAASTAEKRTAFQNPDPLNLRGLQQGFEDATRPLTDAGREASQWTNEQAQRLGDNTRNFIDQSATNLQRGTEQTLRGAGEALDRLNPTNTQSYASPYGDRPNYGGTAPTYPNDTRVAPPQPTSVPPNGYATPTQATDPLGRSVQPGATNNGGYNNGYSDNSRLRGPTLAPPPSGIAGDRLATSFADETPDFAPRDSRDLEPVRRQSYDPTLDSRRSQQGDWQALGPFPNDNRGVDPYPPSTGRRDNFASSDDAFPSLAPPATTPSNYGAPPVGTTPTTGTNFASTQQSANATGWGDNASQNGAAGGVQQAGFANAPATNDRNGEFWSSALLVILGAATAFTWIAYLDVRNKYRSVLRNMPGNSYSAAA